jgi:hypothetical protein
MQTTRENVYTLEIAGKPVLAFAARNFQEAQSLTRETWLRDDLRQLRSQSAALWDGKARLSVRLANDAEAGRYQRESKILPPDPDELAIVYLVDLVDGSR